ncbi:hypothetical protein A1O7_06030 [Cladophialophora yegresii CBS 114405]|uniref:Alcohol dehydrogenase n=1 Tax=Cladophialophora yegresii CBS 114405 TaxID=1182544 RepID=W9VSR5_9EURO|nr:uncharacterized protein A1O7_06030 [Cladophialophora yegresii CBS 114405]EXJ58603.1 hypothetical protein A1O7_06030 [Cladophialophora yegresii CBS 114405]
MTSLVSFGFVANFIHSQFKPLALPSTKYTGQTIIVTGSNAGLGLQSARHFARLDAGKVILAVRSRRKGELAATSIEQSTGCRPGVVEVWDLDLSSYASIQAFADRAARTLDRIDVLVNNAGIVTYEFALVEGTEMTIAVNVVGPLFLSVLLLPKMRETSLRFNKACVVTFVGSFVHFMTTFPERKARNILEQLASRERADMKDRYNVSKLIQLLLARELASQISTTRSESQSDVDADSAKRKPGTIIINVVNPGFVKTEIMRSAGGVLFRLFFAPLRAILARSAEVGSRTILHGAAGGRETHGQYLSDCAVTEPSGFVTSAEGVEVQKKLWKEVGEVLERVRPGVMQNV